MTFQGESAWPQAAEWPAGNVPGTATRQVQAASRSEGHCPGAGNWVLTSFLSGPNSGTKMHNGMQFGESAGLCPHIGELQTRVPVRQP